MSARLVARMEPTLLYLRMQQLLLRKKTVMMAIQEKMMAAPPSALLTLVGYAQTVPQLLQTLARKFVAMAMTIKHIRVTMAM